MFSPMSSVLVIALTSALALVATALLTPAVRGGAVTMGLVRQVQEDRWHRRPTPAIGGVAIYVGFGIALGVGLLLDPDAFGALRLRSPRAVLPWSPWEGLLAASTLAFLLGLVDDLVHLRPLAKLAGQVAAASVLLLAGIGVWLTGVYLVDAALSVLWFVAVTNALNLLDNMDGLAAGVAAIAGAYLTVIFVLDGETSLVVLSLALTGATLGFLLHNYPPARIFMGDSGSHFLGLFLAGLALSPGEGLSRSLLAVLAVPALVLVIPLFDTTVVTLGRVLEGRPISQGGKDHTSHRLVALGLPEERAVWALWTLAAIGGAVALVFRTAELSTAALVGGVAMVALVLVGAYFVTARFRSLQRTERDRLPLYRILVGLHDRYPVLVLVLDVLLIVLAYYAAYLIRWEPAQLPAELAYFQTSLVVVVAAKLLALAAAGVYGGSRWSHFGLEDGVRLLRGSLLASLAMVAALLLVERTGLSRGVVIIDFLVLTGLLVASRLSFRLMEGATERWSTGGAAAVVLGPLEHIGLVRRALAADGVGDLRIVAVADPAYARVRARVGGFPLYGGELALANALHDTGAPVVVVVELGSEPAGGEGIHGPLTGEGASGAGAAQPDERDAPGVRDLPDDRGVSKDLNDLDAPNDRRARNDPDARELLREHLRHHGSVDVYRLRVSVERVEAAALTPVAG